MENEPEPDTNIASQLMLLVVLNLINAYFAAAEMAIVSLNKTRMKMLAEDGNKKAKIICDLIDEPTKFLSTIQVGITLAGFFASASAATGISEVLGETLSNIGIPYGEKISFVGVTIILSYFTLVFGELFPKRLALKKSEAIAMISVRPIMFLSKIAAPFVKILSLSTSLLVKITGLDKENLEERITKEEIKTIVETGEEHGAINENEKEMIEGIFEFDDKRAEKVMTPRTEVYCIDIDEPLENYLDELLSVRYARVPVYEDNIDNIIGVLYMKDFIIEARKKGFENINVREILQEPFFVPECKKVQELFREFQQSKRHIAIIIDEYGGFSGILTIEDLVEEIMGEINDEDDLVLDGIRKIDNRNFLVDGVTTLEEIEDKLKVNLNSSDVDIDTISGFLINIIGKIPSESDNRIIEYNNIVFKINEVTERRIEKVLISLQL